jgi:predicted DCC family thiol-disulfide oxidoreductase YuxK
VAIFVLVQGAWRHGAAWHIVAQRLENNSHRAFAPARAGLAGKILEAGHD